MLGSVPHATYELRRRADPSLDRQRRADCLRERQDRVEIVTVAVDVAPLVEVGARCQVQDDVWRRDLERLARGALVEKVELLRDQARHLGRRTPVDASDLMAIGHQLSAEMAPDETSAPGHEHSHL